MLRKRNRTFTASVYLGRLPDIQADEEGELLNPLDRYIWQKLISQAQVIEGRPDMEYTKDGLPMLIRIPDDCEYWVDEQRVVIARDRQICEKCHGLSQGQTCKECEGQMTMAM